jgi:hypothetical protein
VTVLTLTDRSDRWSDKDLVVFSRYWNPAFGVYARIVSKVWI